MKQSGAQVQAVLHPIDPAVAAWKEYLLKCAFGQICNQAFLRFEEITGRAIIDSFIRTLLLNISRQSVDIQINARRVLDAEVFPSPERAAEIYRSLLRILADQGSTIIGAHLSSAILSQILYLLRADESLIAREYGLVPADILNEEKARVATDV